MPLSFMICIYLHSHANHNAMPFILASNLIAFSPTAGNDVHWASQPFWRAAFDSTFVAMINCDAYADYFEPLTAGWRVWRMSRI